MNNWKLRHSFTGNATSDVQTVNGYLASGEDNDFAVTVVPDGKEYAAPLFIPRTNLFLQSNQFDTTWSLDVDMTLTSGQLGYDGSSDAWLLEKTAIQYRAVRQIPVHSNVVTFSVYAKQGTLRYLNYYSPVGDAPQIWFDLQDGVVATKSGAYIDVKMESVGGGWHRCSVTYDAASGDEIRIYPQNLDGSYGSVAGNIYIQDAQLETASVATEYIPTTTAAVTRDWSAFGRVQNQLPGICNGTHTHTGAASGSGIAATTITGSGSGATFAYEFDTLGVLTTLTADGAGSGYKVGDKLSIDTTEGHDIEFRLVEGSNAATVSVSMGAAKPNKPVPFPVTKMRVSDSTDRKVLIMDQRSRYVFPKPTPYLLDSYEGAAAAYSLRRLRSAYTGPAVRVRRASNNDELDIYFNRDGSLDTATLEAFCAGTDGFVKVWYDQGPGGNDAQQTATGNQPKIYDSSTGVVTENGQPAMYHDTGSKYLIAATPSGFSGKSQSAFVTGISYRTTTNPDFYFSIGDTSASTGTLRGLTQEPYLRFSTTVQDYNSYHEDNVQHLYSMVCPGTVTTIDDYDLYRNGSLLTPDSLSGGTVNNIATDFLHIGNNNNINLPFYGRLQELVFYNSDQSSNRIGIEDNINEHYGIYEFSGLLDDYSGAAAAYSLRRLSSTYTGPAIRVVKHDVGYPEMDIPFEDDGTLSVVLLEAFADGYDATVKVWYDQSGGSNHAEQSTLSSQPKIVDAGTVITENGLPAAQFDGVNDYFTKAFTLGNPVSHFVVGKVNNTNQFLLDGYGDVNRNSLVSPIPNNMRLYNGGGSIFHPYTPGNRYLFSSISNGANSSLAVNGSNSTGNIGTNPMNGVTIGCSGNLNLALFCMNGTIQEIMVYASDQASNRTGIESNINDFYSIYP